MKAIRARSLLAIATLGLLLCSGHSSAEQDFDRESYYRAAEYCRGNVSRPMAVSPDGQVLCFDGEVTDDLDVSPARDLKENGVFVVRSRGGDPDTAVALSDIVLERGATVVVHDYCFSACASFFLIASHRSYVLKGALVAWHYPRSDDPDDPHCTYVTDPPDGKLKKLQRRPCRLGGDHGAEYSREVARFFAERVIDPFFDHPPDSLYVRRMLRNLYGDTGAFRDVLWTLHPRYYPVLFKTKILYEAYPQNQEEVDEMAARLRLGRGRVIYDP
jgi:hypothetical protein